MQKQKVKVGVVGCGGICKATYMSNMVNKFNIIDVVAVADQIDNAHSDGGSLSREKDDCGRDDERSGDRSYRKLNLSGIPR